MATDLNKVMIIGRIVRDLDEKTFGYVGNGTARASVSIAVNRGVKKGDQWEEEASYFDVTIWGKMAENLKPYLVKGTQIGVEGFLKQDRWEKDGKKNSRIAIVAENIQLLGGKSNSSGGQQVNGGFQPRKPVQTQGGFDPAQDFPEDIPF